MISHRFEYRDPRSIEQALEILAQAGGDCAVLGGGTWLVPNMTFAAHQPKIVLDPRHLDFAGISEAGDEISVGARVTYLAALRSPLVQTHLPMLARMCSLITGGVSIVGQGTIGGSACYANPSSDVPACLVAMRARLRLQSTRGVREIAAADFYQGAFATARSPDELLAGIVVPKAASGNSFGYYKLKFSTGSWPIVTAAVTADPERDGQHFRVALGASSAVPLVTAARLSSEPTQEELREFSHACADLDDEWSDEFAGHGYRRSVAPSVVMKALLQCQARP